MSTVRDILAREGVCPFTEMVRMARDPETPVKVRAAIWMQIATYCAPKLKSVEFKSEQLQFDFGEVVRTAKREIFGYDA